MKAMRPIFALLPLCALPLLQPAMACVGERERPQMELWGNQIVAPDDKTPPQEIHMPAGALLSVVPLGRMSVSVLSSSNEAQGPLQALDEALYRELSAQGGGHIPPESDISKMSPSMAKLMPWKRFGAAKVGVSWLRFAEKGKADRWVRIQVDPAPAVDRGSDIRMSEADENREISMQFYDRLYLELPGALGDGWAVTNAEAVGLRLVAIETLPDQPQRVRLKFQVSSDQGQGQLELQNRTNRYRFTIVHRPTPLC